MGSVTKRTGYGAFVEQDRPGANFNAWRFWKLRAVGGAGWQWGYVRFATPVPLGATITKATLRLYARGAWPGQQNIEVHPLGERLRPMSRITWSNRPAIRSGSTPAVAPANDLAGQDEVAIDVTHLIQEIASGAPNYGFRVTSTRPYRRDIWGFDAGDDLAPKLEVEWSDAPLPPTNLRPATGAVSTPTPALHFDFNDVSGDLTLAALNVQVSAPSFDSGWVDTTAAFLDLADTAFTGVVEGSPTQWRVRARDGAGLESEWSDWADLAYEPLPAVTITNLTEGVAYEPTPPIIWDPVPGQARYAVRVLEPGEGLVHTSGPIAGQDTSYTIPGGVLKDGHTYTIEVRVWDDKDREAVPGAPAFASGTASLILDVDATVGPVTALTATPTTGAPYATFAWERTTTPDEFLVYQEGALVARLDPLDVFVSGTSYEWTYSGAKPNTPTAFRVHAVVNGRRSVGTAVEVTTRPSGIWIVDDARGISFALWGDEEGTWDMEDDAEAFTPLGGRVPVRIVQAVHGWSGTLTGKLADGWGRPFEEHLAAFLKVKERPSRPVRLITGDQSFLAYLGNMAHNPLPVTRSDQAVHDAVFDFWQADGFTFNSRI